MKVWIYTVCWNESRMVVWYLRHYSLWADKIIVFCEPSSDGTEDILRSCPKVDLRVWPHRGLDDEKFLATVNTAYTEARGKADWCAFVDMDELLYHPHMATILKHAECDVLPATGYALISPTGWPKDDGHSQLYDLVRTGVRQLNYDKHLFHKPELTFQHTIGRHTYPGVWPRHNGTVGFGYGIKLLHCHHVGGVEDTKERNARNYKRALKKKYAWNFAPGANEDPNQSGSVEWVRKAIENKELIKVV